MCSGAAMPATAAVWPHTIILPLIPMLLLLPWPCRCCLLLPLRLHHLPCCLHLLTSEGRGDGCVKQGALLSRAPGQGRELDGCDEGLKVMQLQQRGLQCSHERQAHTQQDEVITILQREGEGHGVYADVCSRKDEGVMAEVKRATGLY